MRLKRLELQGYKSFASRTEFVFPTGITAIVGPNGSGKSNIADAIRWVLGEQSLRLMRGKSTTDMIFTGSKRRPRSGMAEVLLTLDNDDGWLPVEFSEVTIGRRAFRSGESEYLLNNNRIRLRDLSDLLAESGLSQRTYAVIGQGLIDTALSLRPQERRTLFEEAAGIAIYRARREEALGRLEETARNLDRVRDILGEITPRLKRLEQQAERFQEYERLAAHLERLLRAWYGYHWGQAQEALKVARERAHALEELLAGRRQELDAVSGALDELRHRQTDLRASLRDAYRRIADLHDQADAVQRELATLTERSRLLAAQHEEVLAELPALQAQREAQSQRVEQARAQAAALRERVATQEAQVSRMESDLAALRRRAAEGGSRREQFQSELAALRARQKDLEASVGQARTACMRLEAEQELLAQLRDEASGFSEGARALLRTGLPGVVGLLSQLLQVPAEWEQAVEAALGTRAQALVVRDWAAVELARQSLGAEERVVLLPLSELRAQGGPAPAGALRAADVVHSAAEIRPAIEALLGQTWLVGDLAAAQALRDRLSPGAQCVTRAGEVVSADGAVTLGAAGGVLARERAWRELPARMEAARSRRDELESELGRVAQALAELEAARQQAEREAAEASNRLVQAEAGPLGKARTELALARQAAESQLALLRRETAELERIETQLSARQKRAEELAAGQAASGERLARLRQESTRFEQELADVRARIGPAEETLNGLSRQQEEAEARERQVRMQVRQMEEQVSRAQLEAVRCQDALDRLQERIREELGLVELEVAEQVTVQTPLPLHPLVSRLPVVEQLPEGLEVEIQRLKARLHQLGPVNPAALQEYEEAAGRHRFLSEQLQDLEQASARLREVIDELNQKMEQSFLETFQAIAAAFEEFFARLFNGGSGRLELLEAENLLDAGVDIIARPPGKRTQGLAMLSGGERALTAAALIFAILSVRATPFCVLDEVDAMLDEANVVRFRTVLEELSARTQFIVITHNRGTVEAADTAYGISMGSDGVSQVVSLRLEGREVAG